MNERLNIVNIRKADVIRPLVAENLSKLYSGKFLAVDKLSLGVDHQQVFGLLGLNGSGKTTTFKMLTGNLRPDSGHVLLDGKNVTGQANSSCKDIGYCPQFDALYDEMSVVEHLDFFANLRGLTGKSREIFIEFVFKALQLERHKHKLASTLSGGNERKLQTAILIIGKPSILLLD